MADIKKKRLFEVQVTRNYYMRARLHVEADSEEEAERKALDFEDVKHETCSSMFAGDQEVVATLLVPTTKGKIA